MIYLYSVCLKCGSCKVKDSTVITRAKASLLLASFERQNCPHCKNKSYPNLKWNKESKKWEIEQGFTKDQLPKKSRRILKKTSKLQIFKSWLSINQEWFTIHLSIRIDHSNVFYSNICPENVAFYKKSKYILHFPSFLIYPKKFMLS